jgi:hypothetical protein
MIDLLKYTYLLENEKIKKELERLYDKYSEFIKKAQEMWEQLNEARAILYLTGNIYCEKIAVEAIERRLHLLKEKLSLVEFFDLIDKNSEKLIEFRKDELFKKLEEFYRIIKEYKNKYSEGKYYLDEEKFIQLYNFLNPNQDDKIRYKGKFNSN